MIEMMLEEAANAVFGKLMGKNIPFKGISKDTRTLIKDQVYIALVGEKFDGHDFIDLAYQKGAIAVITQKPLSEDKNYILVNSTAEALLNLASYYRAFFTPKVIAITGSVGKTTTKELVASLVSQKFKTLKNIGNLNNEIGLPMTVFNLDKSIEAVVLEMGMNHFGEIENLSKVSKPDIALINNIGVAHLENLGSKKGILKAKMEITRYLKKGGTLVLNGDDPLLCKVQSSENYNVKFFGITNKQGVFAEEINVLSDGKTTFVAYDSGRQVKLTLKQLGKHMVLNALGAVAVAFELGLSDDEIKKGLEEFEPTGMRMLFLKAKNGMQVINDSYNANPDSMKAAIDVLFDLKGKKAVILGDMFELGANSDLMHKEIGVYSAHKDIDLIITIGNKSINTYMGAKTILKCNQKAVHFDTKEDFYKDIEILDNIDIVLIKASRAASFEEIADFLTK